MDNVTIHLPGSLLQRHAAFWQRGEADSPLLRERTYVRLRRGGLSAGAIGDFEDNRPIYPEEIKDSLSETILPDAVIAGDLIAGLDLPGMCWTEGFTGCRISMGEGGAWADRLDTLTTYIDADMRSFLESTRQIQTHPWLEALTACTTNLVRKSAGRFPVVQPLLRGPLDMMASALGHSEMVTAFIDNPDLAGRFLGRCTDMFLRVASTHFDIAPPFADGSVMFGILNKCKTVRTQLDNAVLLSPDLYRTQIAPQYRRIFEAFPNSIIHVHSGSLHIVDELLSEPHLTAIQVSRDWPAGPQIDELIPIFQKILTAKPLVITGPVSRRDLDSLKTRLSPRGLCLDVLITD